MHPRGGPVGPLMVKRHADGAGLMPSGNTPALPRRASGSQKTA
jgi:hypothetical protein